MAVHAEPPEAQPFEASGPIPEQPPVRIGNRVTDCVLPRAVAEKMEAAAETAQPEAKKVAVLTVNARGELLGDLSALPEDVLKNLQAPEGQEQLRAMYRKEFGTSRRVLAQRIQPRVKAGPRDFRELCPPGMTNREFRKLRRTHLRKQTKAVLKEMRHAAN